LVYLYALGANFCFALASQVFTHYSRRVSAQWMNCMKALVAFIAFLMVVGFSGDLGFPGLEVAALMILSGALGLGIGDWFLLSAFREIGPGRTMILFGFQPLLFGAFGYFLFDQTVPMHKFWGILFFVLCLVTLSRESFRVDRSYGLKGLTFAFVGMLLDASGAMISRWVFDHHPELSVFEGNMYRCLGALLFFAFMSRVQPLHFVSTFKLQSTRGKWLVLLGSLLGTFVSLSLYLKALQSAHLASLSGIAITGSIFSASLECLIHRKLPSKSLVVAFIFFFAGMSFILS
jgi:drug/metabolite transporter (DMT)-like permease